MKKILSLVLVLVLSFACLVACGNKDKGNDNNNDNNTNTGNSEKTYSLSVVVDNGLAVNKSSSTVIALALVTDADGKIVAARFDSVQPKLNLNADKTELAATGRFDTKVELGDSYTGMNDSWKDEAAAFESFLVGKTAAQVAELEFVVDGADAGLVTGCTMTSSMPAFKTLIAKAAAYERKVTFKTSETVTLGLAMDAKTSGTVAAGAKVNMDVAGVAIAGGKVVAAMLDSAEASYTVEIGEVAGKGGTTSIGLVVNSYEYKGTKNEQGENYDPNNAMPAGDWYKQAQAYANTAVGKTVAELADLSTEKIEGSVSVYTGGYKATIVRAAGYAR